MIARIRRRGVALVTRLYMTAMLMGSLPLVVLFEVTCILLAFIVTFAHIWRHK